MCEGKMVYGLTATCANVMCCQCHRIVQEEDNVFLRSVSLGGIEIPSRLTKCGGWRQCG